MEKQDLNGTRTAQDIEQKYKLGLIPEVIKMFNNNNQVLEKLRLDLKTTNSTLKNFTEQTLKSLETLQDEVDGSITSYYSNGEPTLKNYPTSEWSEEEYNTHLGDLYYDRETGYSYRFYLDNNEYKWVKLSDSDITKALAIANSAKDTADNKRRVFSEQPFTPYDSGDLWLNNNELYVCQISRQSGEYETDDFIKAVNYTDDTYAKAVEDGLSNSIEIIDGRVTRIEESNSEYKITLEERITSIQNQTNETSEYVKNMSYSFGTDNLKIAKSDDPTNLTMDNTGLKIYNQTTLNSIFNKNGVGIDKLILVKSFQFQNILLKKRQIERKDTGETIDVISCFWLVNLIETLNDLEE